MVICIKCRKTKCECGSQALFEENQRMRRLRGYYIYSSTVSTQEQLAQQNYKLNSKLSEAVDNENSDPHPSGSESA